MTPLSERYIQEANREAWKQTIFAIIALALVAGIVLWFSLS